MKCVVLQGSPRKGGNCEVLVNEVVANMEGYDVNNYFLDELNIEPCHACGACGDGIDCVTEDDGAKIIEDMLDADVIIFSTPIYYGQMTAQGKLITDRFYSVSRNPQKSFEGKKAVLIFTHGAPEGVYETYIELTKAAPFGHCGMDVVGVIAAGGIQEPGAVKDLEEKMVQAKEIGASL